MAFYWYLILAFFGGIPAGMGMGGGTVTIPLLTLAGGVPQKMAQAANLFAFLPMSVGALKKHADSGLLVKEGLMPIILPALIFSGASSIIVAYMPGELLGKAFGVFLIGLGRFTLKSALLGRN